MNHESIFAGNYRRRYFGGRLDCHLFSTVKTGNGAAGPIGPKINMKNKNLLARIERLQNRAQKLWRAKTLSPQSWQNLVAEKCWQDAEALKKKLAAG